MNSSRKILLLVFCSLLIGSCNNESTDVNKQDTENLIAFSKVYGYVKYFHPSDEALQIDWDKLAILGVEKVMNAKSRDELKATLDSLFTPIAPTITISETKPDSSIFLSDYVDNIKLDTTNLKSVAWQHFGVNLEQVRSVYKSIRINRVDSDRNNKGIKPDSLVRLFDEYPKVGETANQQISDALWVQVPLALFSTENKTLPESSEEDLIRIKRDLSSIDISNSMSVEDRNLRVANVIIAWNKLQHFYPYFEIIDTDWDEQLRQSIKKAITDKTIKDFHNTLSSLLAATHDGHINLRHQDFYFDEAGMPFLVDWVEDKIIVTHSLHRDIQRGDIIISINGESATEKVQDQRKYISGSPQLTLFQSLRAFGKGEYNTEAVIQVESNGEIKSYTVPRSSIRSNQRVEKDHLPITGQIENGIYYVDLDRASMDRINDEINDIASSPGVIFDLRGYPNSNHQVIQHLLTSPDTSEQWMKVPKIIYPDQQRIVGYQNFGWQLEPAKPHIQGNVVFITDARAISYAESFMGFIEHYRLGEIVGQPTAGTNGNVNRVVLPGGFRFAWTGMKVTKHDGSQHHLVGIQPTVPVIKTIKGVREDKDEFLDKAVQVLRESGS